MRKNVVFILCDQLRKDCISSYGNTFVHTPHIDQLTQAGTVYERCYVTNPICMPSRLSIFSGMYPRNHGLFSNGVLVPDEGMTLPHHLQEYGYETVNIGKMHFEPTEDLEGHFSQEARVHWKRNPHHQMKDNYWGFQRSDVIIGHSVTTGNYRSWFLENGGTDRMFDVDYDGVATGPMAMPAHLHCSTYIGETATTYIRHQRKKDKPFFLTVSFPDPHFPFTPPAECVKEREVKWPVGTKEDLQDRPIRYRQHYEGRWSRKGIGQVTTPQGISEDLTHKRIAYTYDMVELIDENVGKIIEAIKEEDLFEDTIFVFVADHGELLGDHGLWLKGPFLYEGLINVPLILVDHQAKEIRSDQLISTVDIVPTLCDLLDVPHPYYIDGISLKNSEKKRDHCLIEYRTGTIGSDFAVYGLIDERYKLIRDEEGHCELTDLVQDPHEHTNLAQDEAHAGCLRHLNEKLLDELIKSGTKRYKQIAMY